MKLHTKIFLIMSLILMITGCSKKEKPVYLYQLTNQSSSQMMSYIIEEPDGDLIVIDGGTMDDLDSLIETILSIREDGQVTGWFLTHYHKDHTGALANYLILGRTELDIKNIYCHFPTEEWVKKNEEYRLEDLQTINKGLEKTKVDSTLKKGDVKKFSAYQLEVLRDFDIRITNNAGNNSSLVYKVTTEQRNTILFLGDLGEEGGKQLLEQSRDKIKDMDYVQMAHHGQRGVTEEVYKAINPSNCLWPTTDWLWENKDKTFDTDKTKAWMNALNVKNHYIAKDGTQVIRIE